MRKVASLLLSLLLLSQLLNVFAQEQTPPAPAPQQQDSANNPHDDEVVRITTNLVQVDAVVLDKNGRYVTDLRPEDFQVVEDGKRQESSSSAAFKGFREERPSFSFPTACAFSAA